LAEAEVRTYISEPDRGRRRWRDKLEAQQAVYGNRRRICGERGKELLGVGNCWNGASRTPMKREGCGECSCEGEKMFSSEGWFTWAHSTCRWWCGSYSGKVHPRSRMKPHLPRAA